MCPDSTRIIDRFAEHGIEVAAEALFAAHYHGVRAIDLAQAAPEEFGHYHAAYVDHLGIHGEPRATAIGVLEGLWERSALWTEALPWAVEGLDALLATGIPIVIVSNADGTVASVLAELLQIGPGPGAPVHAIIDSGAVGVAKPDPRIFELALATVGATADRAIHIGDAYQYDVRGARAAGVTPVLIDPLGIRGDVDCLRVADLVAVVDLLTD